MKSIIGMARQEGQGQIQATHFQIVLLFGAALCAMNQGRFFVGKLYVVLEASRGIGLLSSFPHPSPEGGRRI